MNLLSKLARRSLDGRLSRLRHGRVVVRDGTGSRSFGDPAEPPMEVNVHDARFYRALALDGVLGAGEAYTEGWWTTDDLTGVIRLMLRNRAVLEDLETSLPRITRPFRRLAHVLNRNSRRGSRRNIGAHYDLGNDFFELFLDETLTYSCGLFERPDTLLRDASVAKYDRIAALLDLQPTDHMVEIGSGWGGFAIHAATRYGCRVTATTISEEQFRLATRRVAEAGLSHRVEVVRQDYRDLEGTFDKLASIEMIEAVGPENFGLFFEQCASLLAPHGRAAIQAIVVNDLYYLSARRDVDFIKRHIFPGSCIPSRTELCTAAATTDLTLVGDDEMGLHYAETLRRWRANMRSNRDRITNLGFDKRFQRKWEFYFCYCEGGFLERAIGTAQMSFAKPAARFATPPPAVPVLVSAA